MKHQAKFDIYLDHTYSPIKIYDRLYPFSEVLAIRRPDLYEKLYEKFIGEIAPPNTPVTARPNRH